MIPRLDPYVWFVHTQLIVPCDGALWEANVIRVVDGAFRYSVTMHC